MRSVMFAMGVTFFGLSFSSVLYGDEFVGHSRADQLDHLEPDYLNAKHLELSKDEPVRQLEKQTTYKRSMYPTADSEVVNEKGFQGSGQRNPETLIDRLNTVGDQSKQAETVNSAGSDVSTQEYGRYGDIPYTQSRVDMYGDVVSDLYPYSAIGKLFFTVPNGDTFTCSASLIKPGLVITAAHCVTEFGGEWYDDFTFVPAYNMGVAPYGVWEYEEVLVTTNYKEGTSFCTQVGVSCVDDVAVLKLENKIGPSGQYPLGASVGWLGWAYGDIMFSNTLAHISQFGYPGSHDGGQRMQRTDSPAFLNRSVLEVDASSRQTQGSSGGPWIVNFGELAILSNGVSVGQAGQLNTVIAVTSNGTVDDINKEITASALTYDNFGVMLDQFCPDSTTDLACVYNFPSPSGEDIILLLEEPNNGSNYSGVSNVRGFALAPSGIEKIELYVDGQYKSDIPYGGSRGDIGDRYPQIPDSRNSGFGMTYNYNNPGAGQHSITIRAVSKDGTFKDVTNSFAVHRFHASFFPNENSISIGNSALEKDGARILIRNLSVDGQVYNVWLKWKSQTQGFEIDKVE